MKGRIYICGAFTSVRKSKCGGAGWLDNDPHFWTRPPTWGICRPDLRKLVKPGDYVFFVLPARSDLPQTVFAYLRVKETITHMDAYRLWTLWSKRMKPSRPGQPNGNIIVDARGRYNKYDGNDDHKVRFHRIKEHYVVGDERVSVLLSERKIRRLAPEFPVILERVFGENGTAFDIISRWGRVLSEKQVTTLRAWLREDTRV